MTRFDAKWRGLAAFFGAILLWEQAAVAHPLSRGALDVVVHPDRVTMRARITVEEVVITDMLTTNDDPSLGSPRASVEKTYGAHARYLSQHVYVAVDGAPLVGRVVQVIQPTTQPLQGTLTPDKDHVAYELEYAPAGGGSFSKRPEKVELRHDALVGLELAPGVSWEASYVIRIGTAGGPAIEGLLLSSTQRIAYECEWTPQGRNVVPRERIARDYVVHGIHHILTGYDHLLFISALVLAAVGLWDLVKVVTAFTVAHTVTLTLAALRLVYLPDWIVEPMIAASIVFVALQNVLWPKQARGWSRLAVAFGFGLFHGLGYAGGLLDAMQEMSGVTILLAIAMFSIGVEIGHQLVVIPLFGVLKLARRTRSERKQRETVSLLALRYGSAAICIAGMYYFVAAVSAAIAVAGRS